MRNIPQPVLFDDDSIREVIEAPNDIRFLVLGKRFARHLYRVEQTGVVVRYVPHITNKVIMATQALMMSLFLALALWAAGEPKAAFVVLGNVSVFLLVLAITMHLAGPRWRKIKVPAAYENYVRNALNSASPSLRTLKVNIYLTSLTGVQQIVRKERALELPPEVAKKFKSQYGFWASTVTPEPVPVMDGLSDEEFIEVQKRFTSSPF